MRYVAGWSYARGECLPVRRVHVEPCGAGGWVYPDPVIVEFSAPVFTWSARTEAWFFAALPGPLSEDIREIPRIPRGFGSVRVRVTVGGSTWQTSIFPDASRGSYVLPLKRSVREVEGIHEGSEISVRLEIIDG